MWKRANSNQLRFRRRDLDGERWRGEEKSQKGKLRNHIAIYYVKSNSNTTDEVHDESTTQYH